MLFPGRLGEASWLVGFGPVCVPWCLAAVRERGNGRWGQQRCLFVTFLCRPLEQEPQPYACHSSRDYVGSGDSSALAGWPRSWGSPAIDRSQCYLLVWPRRELPFNTGHITAVVPKTCGPRHSAENSYSLSYSAFLNISLLPRTFLLPRQFSSFLFLFLFL